MADVVYKPRLSTLVSVFKHLYSFEEDNIPVASDETTGDSLSFVYAMKYVVDSGYKKGSDRMDKLFNYR